MLRVSFRTSRSEVTNCVIEFVGTEERWQDAIATLSRMGPLIEVNRPLIQMPNLVPGT
jgi:hypothetical protein